MMWTIHHIVDVCVCLCLASGCHDNRYMTVRVLSRITTRRELSRHTLPWRVEFWFQSIPGHFIYRDGSHRWISTIYFFSHHPQGFNIVWAFFFWMIDLSFCVCACVCLFCYFFMSFFFWLVDRSVWMLWKSRNENTQVIQSSIYILSVQQPFLYSVFTTVFYTHSDTQPISSVYISHLLFSLDLFLYNI